MQEGARKAPETIQPSDIIFSETRTLFPGYPAFYLISSRSFSGKIITAIFYNGVNDPVSRKFALINAGKEMTWQLSGIDELPHTAVTYKDRLLATLANLITTVLEKAPADYKLTKSELLFPAKNAQIMAMYDYQSIITCANIIFKTMPNLTSKKPFFYLRQSRASSLYVTAEICKDKILYSGRFALIDSAQGFSWHAIPNNVPIPGKAVKYEAHFSETFANLIDTISETDVFRDQKLTISKFVARAEEHRGSVREIYNTQKYQARDKKPDPISYSYDEINTPVLGGKKGP